MKYIVPCYNAASLAKSIQSNAKKGISLVEYESRKFPDGEILVRILSPVKGKDLVFVQNGYPKPNNSLMELMLGVDAAKDLGAKELTTIFPYVPYARQDKRFKAGEAWSLKTMFTLLKSFGVKRVVTVDAHYRNDYGNKTMFGVKNLNISAGALLVEHIKKKFKLKEVTIISPDLGASNMVKEAAKVVEGAKYAALKKVRTGDYEVSMEGKLDVESRAVVVLDDIISTGGTMQLAMHKARAAGATQVFAAATHGIFGWDALDVLNKAADYLVTTDSIPNPTSFVTLAPALAQVLV